MSNNAENNQSTLDLVKIKNTSDVPGFFKSNKYISDEPLFKIQKNIFLLKKNSNPENIQVYNTFLSNFEKYVNKQSDNLIKQAYDNLNSRNIIYLGKYSNSVSYKLPGGIVLTPKKHLAAIVLDMTTCEIDSKTGNTNKYDSAYISLYFEFIRASIICNEKKVLKDIELDNKVIKLLNSFYLRILGNNITLNDKQRYFLTYDVAYFYYRFMKNIHPKLAITYALEFFESPVKDEAKYILSDFEDKYVRMKDIFSSFIDFKIINIAPAVLIMKTINKYNIFTFYCATTSLDYLIAMLIVSQYSNKFISELSLSATSQHNLETYIYSEYCKYLKYDVNYLNLSQPIKTLFDKE